MTQDFDEHTEEPTHKVSVTEVVVGVLCVLGVLIATGVALRAADVPLFSRHMMEVVGDAWTRTATVGVIVALIVAALVGVFVIMLAKATLGHDPRPAATEHGAPEPADH
jgi:multisubunit Na+/H+ antiporter MnhB subunit